MWQQQLWNGQLHFLKLKLRKLSKVCKSIILIGWVSKVIYLWQQRHLIDFCPEEELQVLGNGIGLLRSEYHPDNLCHNQTIWWRKIWQKLVDIIFAIIKKLDGAIKVKRWQKLVEIFLCTDCYLDYHLFSSLFIQIQHSSFITVFSTGNL